MKRVSPLILAVGLGILLLGLTMTVFQERGVAQAALPAGHPNLEGPLHISASVSTTIDDFFLPGTQPNMLTETIVTPEGCRGCHGTGLEGLGLGQPADAAPWIGWRGSMMSQSGRDPVFWAALDIANIDADQAGDLCLRCHVPRGWLEGRSTPTDGSALTPIDIEGISCEVCHRMVDPVYDAENPARDLDVLAEIDPPLEAIGNGAIILDPLDERRGPFNLQDDWDTNPHITQGLDWPLPSPYHQEAALCGSCHDVSNPLFSWDEASQTYKINDLGEAAPDLAEVFPIERTYSEWLLSEYNTEAGVYAPQFGGNLEFVSTCQDCHMRDITGAGGEFFGNTVIRDDMPLHDLTGGNTWVPQTLPLHPTFGANFTGVDGQLRAQALISGTVRARYMLQNAATLQVFRQGNLLYVVVVNETGHKLPTGYPEGRRMWVQVEGFDGGNSLVYESGAYDYGTGDLTHDADLKLYEHELGLTPDWASVLGLPAGQSFHFIINNVTLSDNRIPPRGYNFDAFNAAGAAPYTDSLPDPTRYAEGQYWDVTTYVLPDGVVTGTVRLLYQTASKEYIEFLQDNNPNGAGNNGEILYDLWEMTDRSRPETMGEIFFDLDSEAIYLPVILQD